MVVYSTTKPSQDGRHEARVFALAMGVLFSIIFALHVITMTEYFILFAICIGVTLSLIGLSLWLEYRRRGW